MNTTKHDTLELDSRECILARGVKILEHKGQYSGNRPLIKFASYYMQKKKIMNSNHAMRAEEYQYVLMELNVERVNIMMAWQTKVPLSSL